MDDTEVRGHKGDISQQEPSRLWDAAEGSYPDVILAKASVQQFHVSHRLDRPHLSSPSVVFL